MADEQHPEGVCVFGPSTFVTVTVENGADADEIHFHAGGQGFWIARLLGRLGVPTRLVTALGGEAGRAARALVEAEPIDLRSVGSSRSSGAWVHDRRSGERVPVAEDAGRPLGRHVVDELYGATLAGSMDAGICVIAGPHQPSAIDPENYERLCRDLRDEDVVVIADLSGDHLLAALAGGVDLCKASDEDLAETGSFGDLDGEGMVRRLQELGAGAAVVTRADRPLLAVVDDEVVEVSAPSFQVRDHRGAGDAFTALMAASCQWGLDWRDGLRWGAAAGALTVARRGLATADRREIHQILDRVEIRSAGTETDDGPTTGDEPRTRTGAARVADGHG